MAELQLLTALLTMHKSIGDILEAAQHEGGTNDVFEIQVAHELVNVEWARLLARPTPDAPTPTSRKRKGAPPTSDAAASRQSEKKRAWVLELYQSSPDKRPHPRGFALGKKLTSGFSEGGTVKSVALDQLNLAATPRYPHRRRNIGTFLKLYIPVYS